MKLSERIRDAIGDIWEGPAVLLGELADEVAQLEEDSASWKALYYEQHDVHGIVCKKYEGLEAENERLRYKLEEAEHSLQHALSAINDALKETE